MRKLKISLLIISLFILILGITYASYNFLGKSANSDAGGTGNDIWTLNGDYIYQNPDGNSAPLGTVLATLSGTVNTDLFGDFYYNNINFLQSNNTHCAPGKTYSISGSLYSIDNNINSSYGLYGVMNFVPNESFYCPSSGDWLGTLYSDLLGYKVVGNTGTTDNPTLAYEEEGIVGASFNIEELVLVKGKIGTNNLNNLNDIKSIVNIEHGDRQFSKILNVSILKSEIIQNIDKNIYKLTSYITPINKLGTGNYPTGIDDLGTRVKIKSLNNNKSLYYFDYSGEEDSISNEDNKGKILEISNGSFTTSGLGAFTDYQVGVKGYKTVIVKGGNVYIDADIYNVDKDSLLVLVVKRDEKSYKKQNGGNVYINPNVTNIDAVIIAEGSIINYDPGNGLVITDPDLLRRQLYIYGSIFTSNTIGGNKNPYGSDGYIKYGKNSTYGSKKYDLAKLRYFNLIVTTSYGSECSSNENLLAPRVNNDTMDTLKYAWAGKRECFNEIGNVDNTKFNLRGSKDFNPIIIEYNPLIQRKPPFILQNN